MQLIRKLTNFWLMLMGFIGLAYFSVFNVDRIAVNIPHISQITIPAAQVYLIIFFLGAAFASVHFAMDSMKKGWEIRRKNKIIRELEAKLRDTSPPSSTHPVSKSTKIS